MATLMTPLLILGVLLNGWRANGQEAPIRHLDYSLQYYKCETYGHKCIDATQCSTVLKLLQGTNAQVSRAQFMFCGEEHDDKYIDDDNEYGFGPVPYALGPPLACCSKENIISFPFVNDICNKQVTELRDHRCGLTSVFYLNLEIKKVLMEEYRYRLNQVNKNGGKPCVHASMDFRWRGKRCVEQDGDNNDGDPDLGKRVELGDIVFKQRTRNRQTRMSLKRGRPRYSKLRRQRKRMTSYAKHGTPSLPNRHERQKRFIGGLSARIGQFPFLAVIYFKEYKKGKGYIGCTGSIIHPLLIMTAQTCVTRGLIMEIWTGGFQYRNDTKFGVSHQFVNGRDYPLTYEPQRAKFHFATNVYVPQDRRTNNIFRQLNGTFLSPYGMTLIKLIEGLQYDDFTQPVCIPTSVHQESWFEGPRVSVGFGFGTGTQLEGYPRYAYLDKTEDCYELMMKYYGKSLPMKDTENKDMWDCVIPGQGTQPCMFDEGAPLLRMTKDGFMMQTGILMRMPQESCGFIKMPIVYLSLNRFVDWFQGGLQSLFSIPPPPFSRYPPNSVSFGFYDTSNPSNCLSDYEKTKYDGKVNDV